MQNLIDLSDVRRQRAKAKTQSQYQDYLKSLSLSQLEIEANHLLEEFSEQMFGEDYSLKVQALLSHMAERAEGPFKEAIKGLDHTFE